MDPQKNVNPTTSDEEQNTAGQVGAQDQDNVSPVNDSATGAGTPSESQGSGSAVTPDSGLGMGNDATTDNTSFEQATPSATSGTPVDNPTEVSFNAGTAEPSAEPPATTEPTAPAAPDTTPGLGPDTTGTVTPGVTGMPADAGGQAQPTLPTDQSPLPTDASQVPPTAPTPASHNDKKTVVILGVVAVILLAAIATLYVL